MIHEEKFNIILIIFSSIVLIILISFAFMQGKIGGYAIFDYKGSTQQFDVDRAYLIYTKDVSDDLFFKFRLDVGRDTDTDGDTKFTLSQYLNWWDVHPER